MSSSVLLEYALGYDVGIIGIAVYPQHGKDSKSLISNAELAVSTAKKQGGNRSVMFTEELPAAAHEKLILKVDLLVGYNNMQRFDPATGNTVLLGKIADDAQYHERSVANDPKETNITPYKAETLLEEINVIDSSPLNGNTPLILAIKCGMIDLAVYLLEHGARVDICDARGFFPIHYAAMLRNELMVQEIIRYSPELKAEEIHRSNKKTAFYSAGFVPTHQTSDWLFSIERQDERGDAIEFVPDITAETIFKEKAAEDCLSLPSNSPRSDCRAFKTKSFVYTNLHWHVVSIVNNLNLLSQLTPEEFKRIKSNWASEIANQGIPVFSQRAMIDMFPNAINDVNFDVLPLSLAAFISKQVFIVTRNKLSNTLSVDNRLDSSSSNTRPVA